MIHKKTVDDNSSTVFAFEVAWRGQLMAYNPKAKAALKPTNDIEPSLDHVS